MGWAQSPWAFKVALVVKNPSANAGEAWGAGSILELGRSPRVGNGTPLPGKFHGQRSLVGYPLHSRVRHDWAHMSQDGCHSSRYYMYFGASQVTQVVKTLSVMYKTQVQSLGWEDPLEKGVAIHSSILAWWIPWTEEPGGLQSMGLQRVGHNWLTNTLTSVLLSPVSPTAKFHCSGPCTYNHGPSIFNNYHCFFFFP